MEEKLFRILLGGLLAIVCPEDGRWTRILPSGWDTVNQRLRSSSCRKFGRAVIVYPVLSRRSLARQRRSAAYAGAKGTECCRNQREKDEIRQERLVQYLTRAAKVAKALRKLATLGQKLATLSADFVNPEGSRWQP